MQRNPFLPRTKEEIDKINRMQADIARKVKQTIKLGNKCLNHPDFIKYRQKVKEQREWLIKLAEGYKNSDPVEYAFVVSNILTQTAVLGTLIEDVQRDARKTEKGK